MHRGIATTETAAFISSTARTRQIRAAGPARRTAQSTSRAHHRHGLLKLAVAVAVAVAVLGVELAHPALYAAPTLRATIETATTLFALLAALLLGVRFLYSRSLSDIVLLGAVLTLAVTYLCAYSLPLAANSRFGSWLSDTAIWGVMFAAVAFSAATLARSDKVLKGVRKPILGVAAVSVAAVALAVLGAMLLRRPLAAYSQRTVGGIAFSLRHPLVVVLAIIGAGFFVHAAVSLLRLQRREGDGPALLPAALILLAAAQLSQIALPSLAPDDIALSEGVRLLAVVLVLAASVLDAARVHARVAEAASIAARRRVASDLHDGLAQDLAFIVAYGERIADQLGAEHPVVVAARRALMVSRGTIAELTDPPGACAEEALHAVADDLGQRFGIEVSVDVQLDREPAAHVRDHVSRITREAITNASRHGRAGAVMVTLKRDGGSTTLRVRDDGCGLSSAVRTDPGAGGFGLTSMHDRAAALGGTLSVREPGNGGTVLEVVLP